MRKEPEADCGEQAEHHIGEVSRPVCSMLDVDGPIQGHEKHSCAEHHHRGWPFKYV